MGCVIIDLINNPWWRSRTGASASGGEGIMSLKNSIRSAENGRDGREETVTLAIGRVENCMSCNVDEVSGGAILSL